MELEPPQNVYGFFIMGDGDLSKLADVKIKSGKKTSTYFKVGKGIGPWLYLWLLYGRVMDDLMANLRNDRNAFIGLLLQRVALGNCVIYGSILVKFINYHQRHAFWTFKILP